MIKILSLILILAFSLMSNVAWSQISQDTATPGSLALESGDDGESVVDQTVQTNLALKKPASQSSTLKEFGGNWHASRGVDGVKTGNLFDGGFHTDNEENPYPWWQVDLESGYDLSYALLYNRLDCCSERAKTLEVLLSDDGQIWRSVYKHDGSAFGGADGHPLKVDLNGQKARFLRVQLREFNALHLDEVEVFGCTDAMISTNAPESGQEAEESEVIFDNWNTGSANNNPNCYPSITLDRPYRITSIDNYHWNYGQGAPGGTISLMKDDGTIYGPWDVETSPTMDGIPDVFWKASPDEILPAGTYTVVDSDPETWAQNSQSEGCGFSNVMGLPESFGEDVKEDSNARPSEEPLDDGSEAKVRDGSEETFSEKPSVATSYINTSEWGRVPSNQILVVLKDGMGRSAAENIALSLGGWVVDQVDTINLYQIEIGSSTEEGLREAIDKALQDPDVILAFPNQPGEASKSIAGIQCSPLDDSAYEGERGRDYEIIGVQNAWDLIRVCGLPLSDVHVGVVDNGLYKGQGEFDGKANIDTADPNADLPAPSDLITGSHGTGVVNIIAADPDNGGVTGIVSEPLGEKLTVSMYNNFAPPRGDGVSAYTVGSMQSIEKAVDNGAKVISCSWNANGVDLSSAATWKRFFQKMGVDHPDVLFVCSAGNHRQSVNGLRHWPAGLNLPNMITVGNIMNDGTKADSSNTASNNFEVTLAAPGQQAVFGFNNQGDLKNEFGGTSMATPQVTSAAALLKSVNPNLTPAEIKAILMGTAREGVTLGTPGQQDWRSVPTEEGLGGRVLAVDQAVLKVINDQRVKLGMEALDMEEALASARVILTAESDEAAAGEWKVTADIQGVGPQGADVVLDLQGEGAVAGSKMQHILEPTRLTWDITVRDTATVVVKRLDTNGCSRLYLSNSGGNLIKRYGRIHKECTNFQPTDFFEAKDGCTEPAPGVAVDLAFTYIPPEYAKDTPASLTATSDDGGDFTFEVPPGSQFTITVKGKEWDPEIYLGKKPDDGYTIIYIGPPATIYQGTIDANAMQSRPGPGSQ